MFALRFLLVVLAIALVFGKNTSAKKAEKKAAAMTTTEILKAKTAKVAAKAIKAEAAAASSSSSSKKSSSKSAKTTSELVDKRAYMEAFLEAIGDRVVYGECAVIKTSDAKDCELIGRSMCGRPPNLKDPCPEYDYDAASKICTYCF